MKHTEWIVSFVLLAGFGLGCKPAEQNPPVQARANRETNVAAAQLDRMKRETKEAAQEVNNYSYAQKDEFVEKMKGHLAEINRGLDDLGAKIQNSSAAVQEEAKPKMQALREQTSRLDGQLEAARNATAATWEDVKAGFRTAYDEVKEGFRQARQWASDKIKP